MGHPDRGDGLVFNGGDAMRRKPFSITLRITRTRTGWSISFRVQVII